MYGISKQLKDAIYNAMSDLHFADLFLKFWE